MKQEVIIALISAIVDKAILEHHEESNHSVGRRGPRGSDGIDFDFEDHKSRIYSKIESLISENQDNLKLKFEDLNEDERVSLKGPRGQRGKPGVGFNFEENKSEIESSLVSYIDSIKDQFKLKIEELSDSEIELLKGSSGKNGRDGRDFNFEDSVEDILGLIKNNADLFKLNFEDLSDSEIELLKGRDGKTGRDGKSFDLEECRSDVEFLISELVSEIKPELKLRFEDLTDHEIDMLKGRDGKNGRHGEDGKDGLAGKDFNLEECEEEITNILDSIYESKKDGLKLKFEDLSDDERFSLRGSRGQRGRPGDNFDFEDNREDIESILKSYHESKIDDLKLKFSSLTVEEKSELKLKFEDLSDDEKFSLRGSRGQRGKPGIDGQDGKDGENGLTGPMGRAGRSGLPGAEGRDGQDGQDGKDGRNVYDIEIKSDDDSFYLVFRYDDGSVLETNQVDMPTVEKVFNNYYYGVGGGGSGGGSGSLIVEENGLELGQAEIINFQDDLVVDYDPIDKRLNVSSDSCIGIFDEGAPVTTCAKNLNFEGASVEIEERTVMSDWPDLDSVTSIGDWTAGDPSFINVKIGSPSKFSVTKIANEPIAKYDLVNLDSQTTAIKAKIDTYDKAVVAGLAVNSAATGTEVEIVVFGVIEDPIFGFTVNKPLFLSSSSVSTDTPHNTSGKFLTKIGKSYGSGAIFIDINDPIGIV